MVDVFIQEREMLPAFSKQNDAYELPVNGVLKQFHPIAAWQTPIALSPDTLLPDY